MTLTAQPAVPPTRPRFLHNVIWGWAGVVVNLIIGIVLAPIIVKKLGVEQYGVWVLLFSLLDYMRVLDFGFRAAVVNGCARCRARADWEGVNRTLVTASAYFIGLGLICVLIAVAARATLVQAANISAWLEPEAYRLVALIAAAVTVRLALSPLTAVLEAFERFDVINRAYIGALIFRSTGSLAVLFLGYGLVEMAWVVLTGQIGESLYTLWRVRRIVPGLNFSPALISRSTFTSLFRYGRYSAVIAAANLVSINAPVTVLGYFRTAAEVGFFALPFRLLMYSAEGLAKVSDVTASVTAGFDEAGDRQRVWRLAVQTNRHCFALFMPLAIFLVVYGTPLLHLWITPEFAENSGRLFPVMVLSFLFAIAGQYNAGAVLIGQSKHAVYAYGTVVEAVATIVFLLLFVPAHGIMGAAWVVTIAVLSVRGAYLAAALCWQNRFSLGRYLWAVYGAGLATAIPVAALAFALRGTVWPGSTWPHLILAGTAIAAVYFGIGFFSVLNAPHRHAILRRMQAATGRRLPAA